MKITKEFAFESAHTLPWHQGKCKNLHGHSYKLFVTIEGMINENGIVMDFGDLKKIVNENIVDLMDHKNLNDIFENPTCENMVQDFLGRLKNKITGVRSITVRLYETATSYAEDTIQFYETI